MCFFHPFFFFLKWWETKGTMKKRQKAALLEGASLVSSFKPFRLCTYRALPANCSFSPLVSFCGCSGYRHCRSVRVSAFSIPCERSKRVPFQKKYVKKRMLKQAQWVFLYSIVFNPVRGTASALPTRLFCEAALGGGYNHPYGTHFIAVTPFPIF